MIYDYQKISDRSIKEESNTRRFRTATNMLSAVSLLFFNIQSSLTFNLTFYIDDFSANLENIHFILYLYDKTVSSY